MPETLSLKADDGASIDLHEFGGPQQGEQLASLLFLPALGVPVSYYGPLLKRWSAQRHVVAMDFRRANGSRAELRTAESGYSTLIRSDLRAALASEALRGRRVVLVGHSLGGQLALLAAAAGVGDPEAVVVIAAGTSSVAAQTTVVGRAKRAAGITVVRVVLRTLGYWPGNRFGFGGRQPGSLMRDWATEARSGRYRLHGDDFDYEAALGSLAPPALLVGVTGDRIVTAAAIDQLRSRLPETTTRIELTPGDAAASDHFLWARKSPELVIDAVESWLDERR